MLLCLLDVALIAISEAIAVIGNDVLPLLARLVVGNVLASSLGVASPLELLLDEISDEPELVVLGLCLGLSRRRRILEDVNRSLGNHSSS